MKYLHLQKLQYLCVTYNLLTKFQTEKNQSFPVYQLPAVVSSQNLNWGYRQGNYCNNLETRKIQFFIVSKLAVGETISKTVLPHFSKDPITYIAMTSKFTVTAKIIFANMLKSYMLRLLSVY